VGNVFKGWYALTTAFPTSWTQVGTAGGITITLTTPNVGLAVTSHAQGTATTATFSNVDPQLLGAAAEFVGRSAKEKAFDRLFAVDRPSVPLREENAFDRLFATDRPSASSDGKVVSDWIALPSFRSEAAGSSGGSGARQEVPSGQAAGGADRRHTGGGNWE